MPDDDTPPQFTFPKFEIADIPLAKIQPAKYNPRKRLRPGDKEYEDIKRSLAEFGMVQNLIWNKRSGNLIAGHQRLNVGKREFGWKSAPCIVVDLDQESEKRLNIIMNKVGEGNLSATKLSELLADLGQNPALDLTDLGFDESELEALMKKKPTPTKRDPDEAAPIPKKPRTKPGDIYHIISADGHPQHRLICGSSHDRDTWDRLTEAIRPQMIFTDPPYGVAYQSKSKSDKMSRKDIQNDELIRKALEDFLLPAFQLAHEFSQPSAAIYCFFATREHIAFEQALRKAEWDPKQELIWAKQMNLGRSDYHWAHEPCFYGNKTKGEHRWYGDRCQTTLWQDDRPDFESMKKEELLDILRAIADTGTVWDEKRDPPSTYIHPTQKPVSLARRAMRHSTLPRDATVDCFAGSGSTMIAGQLQGRATFSIELEPGFCDSIITRYVETFEECLLYRNGEEIDPVTFRTTL